MTEALHGALDRYRVDPLSPSLPPGPAEVKEQWVAPSGWLHFFLWMFLINPIFVGLAHGQNFLFIFLSPVVPFALYWLHGVVKGQAARRSLKEQKAVEWLKTLNDLSEKTKVEAQEMALVLRSSLTSSSQLRSGLFMSLDAASRALDQALVEHRERAFAPFWDAIEATAAALASYQHGVKQIGAVAQQYYAKLEHRSHSFPPFPYLSLDLPSADEIVSRLKQVVRTGQTDFEFANIWEHRKTRETIKTGFGSLEAAVRQVGASVVDAVQGVHAALDSGFDRLVESQVASTAAITAAVANAAEQAAGQLEEQRKEVCQILDSQDRKLDNIQWRRKPSGMSY